MNPSPLSPTAFTKGALHLSGNIAKVAINVTPKGYSNFLAQLTLATIVLYTFLTAVGNNAGFFSNGLSKSVRDYSLNVLPFLIIAWAYLNRNYGTLNYVGLFALGSVGYISLANLPLAASTPNWLSNTRSAAVNLFNQFATAGAVAAAFSLHA
jgi:hypothetical protein